MKIIVAGNGKVGTSLARQLARENHDVTLIDKDMSVLSESADQFDVMTIQGNCASVPVLKNAEVKSADLLIAVTGADEVNLLTCMTAHGLNKNIHTIARIRNPEYTDQIYNMKDMFALSLTVNPEHQAAVEIERLLRYPGFFNRDTFAKGRVEIVELRIDQKSKLCNVALSDIDAIVNCKVLVCAVLRNGEAITPDGNFVLQPGDRVFVTAPTTQLTKLLNNLGLITKRVNRVILCGGGRVSYYLAKHLEQSHISVTIIESNYKRCTELSELLPNASIIYGDASNQNMLESEIGSDCDALVSATGFDELNMIISIYGKNREIPQIITKISRMEHSNMWYDLPIGKVICPKELCTHSIVRYVRAMQNPVEGAVTMHTIADGQIEAMEFLVDNQTRNCGKQLKDIRLRPNVLLACINHGSKTEIPSGNSTFDVGNTVVVVTNGSNIIHQLNDIFA